MSLLSKNNSVIGAYVILIAAMLSTVLISLANIDFNELFLLYGTINNISAAFVLLVAILLFAKRFYALCFADIDIEIDNTINKYKIIYHGTNQTISEHYVSQSQKNSTDCGLDLIIPKDFVIPGNARGFQIDHEISCAPFDNAGYYLYPRSSISNTSLRLANSVGIIDAGYRGHIIASVDNLSNDDIKLVPYINGKPQRLFQLCSPNLVPFQFVMTDKLDSTVRGAGGFGSTN